MPAPSSTTATSAITAPAAPIIQLLLIGCVLPPEGSGSERGTREGSGRFTGDRKRRIHVGCAGPADSVRSAECGLRAGETNREAGAAFRRDAELELAAVLAHDVE